MELPNLDPRPWRVVALWMDRAQRLHAEACRLVADDPSGVGIYRGRLYLQKIDDFIEADGRVWFVRWSDGRPEVTESCEIRTDCPHDLPHYGSAPCRHCAEDYDAEYPIRYVVPSPEELDELVEEAIARHPGESR